MRLQTASLEWALKHIERFYSSDFFPDPFEFKAIRHQWKRVREFLEQIDLDEYTPLSPLQSLAPKANGTFRVVHQLAPLDAILYTAIVHEIAPDIEAVRLPPEIACSYRIAMDVNGSFFAKAADGWEVFTERTNSLIAEHLDGVVLLCDIVDFYNQIYSHRIRNLIGELSRPDAASFGKIVERFLEALSTKTSRGIPVGPAASIVLAEALMIDLDRKVLATTRDYVRWVDDFRIFFSNRSNAVSFLHEFTRYLHDNHRLVLSGEKTRIVRVADFRAHHAENDAAREKRMFEARAQAMALDELYQGIFEDLGPYDSPSEVYDEEEYERLLAELKSNRKFEVASEAYLELLTSELTKPMADFVLIRRILRNATRYRIRSLLPEVLGAFHRLIPVVREVCMYLRKIVNTETVNGAADKFLAILELEEAKLPYVNMWLAWLYSDESFSGPAFRLAIGKFEQLRDQALLAKRSRDLSWVKSRKNGLDTLGPYEKRAVLYASQILSSDERKVWMGIVKERGDLLEQVVASYLLSL